YTIAITFSKGAGKLGFDEKKYDALSSYYQQLESGEYIPWKAVTSSDNDPVTATLEGTDIDPKKIRFEINGTPITATPNKNIYTIELRGGAEGMTEELLALYKPDEASKDNVLGKLNIVSYDKVERNLVIVPVNGASIPGEPTDNILSQKLTDIYGQAVAAWHVEIKPSINVTLDEYFDDGESGLLTNYTGDMKKVIKAYGDLLDNTYYLFLVTKPKSVKDGKRLLGYMPRSKQAGFIFVDNLDSENAIPAVAHEIGHGAFNLQHTFKEFPLSQGETDNLMDYPNGPSLYKYQWDYIHDPQRVVSLFEDDEDSESNAVTDPAGITLLQNSVFYTASGKSIVLPKGVVILYQCTNGNLLDNLPYIKRFRANGKVYALDAEWSGSGLINFKGYRDEVNTSSYFKSTVAIPAGQKEYDLYLTTQYAEVSDNTKVHVSLSKLKVAALPEVYKNGSVEQGAKTFLEKSSDGNTKEVIENKSFTCDCSDEGQYIARLSEALRKSLVAHANTAYVIKNCKTGTSQAVTADGSGTTQNKNVITLSYCQGSLTVKTVAYPALQKNSKLTGVTQAQVEAAVKDKLNEELQAAQRNNRGKALDDGSMKGQKFEQQPPNGEKMKIDKSNLWSFLPEVVDLGESIYENAALPEKYWNPAAGNYRQSPIQMPGMVAGLSDGVLDEVTEKLQFVKLGLDIATKPEIITNAWHKVRNLKWEDIQKGAKDMAQGKIDKYAHGGPVAYHEGGKDVVMAASAIWGAFLVDKIKKEGDELGEEL
ncbi:MAG TPA: hypothetical protein VIN08_26775, partial [Ohtaekwangia sp.]|uniref:hypothetical protein n=1 Tax=Ohtaekwangia sp. TaxID=2066019 RepID=UPI002F93FAB0